MGTSYYIIGLAILVRVFFIATLFTTIVAHPQCLDFKAPFQPSTSLSFCTEYADIGCCGKDTDVRLNNEYDYIKSQVTSEDWSLCKNYIKTALCQRCSPYAAHIYDAETSGKPRYFPGLCMDYCEDFHDKCHQIVWFLDPQLAALTILGSKIRFCKKAGLQDVDYCYPSVKTNFDPLRGTVATSMTAAPDTNVTSEPNCLCLQPVKTLLANPLYARPAYDNTGRVFVAEQRGKVYIYDARNNEWKGKFLEFRDKSYVTSFPGDERGFLGMAFHPNFASNGRFFLFYSMRMQRGDTIPPELDRYRNLVKFKVRVSEMKVKADDPNKADRSTEKVLYELFQPFANHNGGEMFFGPDGYLYTFHGDGGAAGDPLNAGQNKSLLYGKVLRIDVDSDPSQPYTIPPDNPFINEEGARPEIYAFGVRNIWRCGVDRGDPKTGESKGILCGDVGQSAYEEIDLLKKGANYGWNAREGFECYSEETCGKIGEEELPIHAYDHSVGKSICGGVFYRGCQNPALNGHYIYGDYESRRLFSLTESDGTWTNHDVNLCSSNLCQGDLISEVNGKIMSFGEDEDGEIYVLTSPLASSSLPTGSMLKFVDPRTRNDPSTCNNRDASRRAPLPKRRSITRTGTEENTTARTQCENKNNACVTFTPHLSFTLVLVFTTNILFSYYFT